MEHGDGDRVAIAIAGTIQADGAATDVAIHLDQYQRVTQPAARPGVKTRVPTTMTREGTIDTNGGIDRGA